MGKYLIYGTGKSGICAARLLKSKGKECVFFDEKTSLDVAGLYKKNPDLEGIEIITKSLNKAALYKIDTCVLSPGVPLFNENVELIKKSGIKIIGELELGYSFEKGRVCAITGTNGKTTTTSLTGHILKGYLSDVIVAGNIGDPYTAFAGDSVENGTSVLEVSSFQLETIDTFAPKVSAILNITPDHMDRHKTMEVYTSVKEGITKNQTERDFCVLNYEDEELRRFGNTIKANVVWFSSERELEAGLYTKNNAIYFKGKKEEKIIDIDELNILGQHNHENAMAAIAMCICLDVPLDKIQEGLRTFTAVEHRIEFVCEKSKVKYYNDSKATNTDAAIKGIKAMKWPIVLIAGGYDKKADYTEWIRSFNGNVRHMVLIGESARDISRCAEQNNFTDYSFANTFEDAFYSAKNIARDGDCVLLSPACASWDMFKDYEERGRIFKDYALRS